ncbi:MAG: hypothetical protein EOO00_01370 [Chitinophagaceae bacterium]|nr:MAG: hypothetical protein EOO00_01370 [Chitinophagaceae bacterium]
MNLHFHSGKRFYLPAKTIMVLCGMMIVVALMSYSFPKERVDTDPGYKTEKDSVASVKAFMKVYDVLMSPRCMNCHPSGDVPLQGDNSTLHTMLPKRGKDGKGVYAMKCSNCHQPTKIEGLNKPPSHPDWHLPPANMKMVFQGRTPEQLAKQLTNRKTNGNKTMEQLIAHADDGLIKVGWDMGEGRTPPPLTHAEFKKAWITWISTGAYAPRSK